MRDEKDSGLRSSNSLDELLGLGGSTNLKIIHFKKINSSLPHIPNVSVFTELQSSILLLPNLE